MTDETKTSLRVVAVVMTVGAIAWGAGVVWQVRQADDRGPPMGAICMAFPAFALLIGAGAIWSRTNRR